MPRAEGIYLSLFFVFRLNCPENKTIFKLYKFSFDKDLSHYLHF
jgi:hypothetical protein